MHQDYMLIMLKLKVKNKDSQIFILENTVSSHISNQKPMSFRNTKILDTNQLVKVKFKTTWLTNPKRRKRSLRKRNQR